MKTISFAILLILLGTLTFLYCDFMEVFSKAESKSAAAYARNTQKSIEEAKRLINEVDSLEKADGAINALNPIPGNEAKKLQPYLSYKRAVLLFNQGEEYLQKAANIEMAVTGPEAVDPLGQRKELHPMTTEMLKKALKLYEQARQEVDKYSDGSDLVLNFHINYLKGEVYYRFLQYLSKPETAVELFTQTVQHYKQALKNKPADINTVVNIELLIKNQQQLLANASNPNAKRKQMLNSARAGLGRSIGF